MSHTIDSIQDTLRCPLLTRWHAPALDFVTRLAPFVFGSCMEADADRMHDWGEILGLYGMHTVKQSGHVTWRKACLKSMSRMERTLPGQELESIYTHRQRGIV